MFQQIVKYMGVSNEPQHNYTELGRSPYLYSSQYVGVLLSNAIKRKNVKNVKQVRDYLERYGKMISGISTYEDLDQKAKAWLKKNGTPW